MKTEQLKIVTLNIDELTPYSRNAKKHPREQIEQIKESIRANGFNDPVAVWGDKNIIVEGHGRLIACKELGFTAIDCIRLDHLTDEQRRAYTLSHNKLTMNSGFDDELLELETEELAELGVDIIGFEFDEDDIAGLPTEIEIEKADTEGEAASSEFLRFGDAKVQITEDELAMLNAALDNYLEEVGTVFGFVNYLLNGGKIA